MIRRMSPSKMRDIKGAIFGIDKTKQTQYAEISRKKATVCFMKGAKLLNRKDRAILTEVMHDSYLLFSEYTRLVFVMLIIDEVYNEAYYTVWRKFSNIYKNTEYINYAFKFAMYRTFERSEMKFKPIKRTVDTVFTPILERKGVIEDILFNKRSESISELISGICEGAKRSEVFEGRIKLILEEEEERAKLEDMDIEWNNGIDYKIKKSFLRFFYINRRHEPEFKHFEFLQ